MTTDAPTISFTMSEGFTLTANFIPNPFLSAVGKYSGLFASGDVRGQWRLNLAGSGAFTARVRYNGVSVSFAGKFDSHGDALAFAAIPGGPVLVATLHFDATGIHGTLSDGAFTADVTLDPPAAGDSPLAGSYTIVIPAADDATPTTPDGDGIATLVVDAHGDATLDGILADGAKFMTRGAISANNQLAVYIPLYEKAGVLTGTLIFRDLATSDLDGALFWSHPEKPGAEMFPNAFAITTTAIGARYTEPAPGTPILTVPPTENNAALALGDGELTAPIEQPATLAMDNTVTLPAGFTVTLKPATGRFKGRFLHPLTGEPATFRGVILQKQNAGFGFFLSTAASGYATFSPGE